MMANPNTCTELAVGAATIVISRGCAPDDGRYLTPRLLDGTRLRIPIPLWYVRGSVGRGYLGRVLDPSSGQHYDLFGAVCAQQGCYCDSVAEPVAGPQAPQASEPIHARFSGPGSMPTSTAPALRMIM